MEKDYIPSSRLTNAKMSMFLNSSGGSMTGPSELQLASTQKLSQKSQENSGMLNSQNNLEGKERFPTSKVLQSYSNQNSVMLT